MPRRAQLPNIKPARLDIILYRGDSFAGRLRLQSQGVPVDVTGWGFLAYIREGGVTGPQIGEFIVLVNENEGAKPEDGEIRLYLPLQTAQLLPDTSVWDLEATQFINGISHVRTILRGFVYAQADVTYPFLDAGTMSRAAGMR